MLRAAFFFGLAFLLVSCSSTMTDIRVGTTTFWGEAAFFVAQEQGFFEEHGLNVTAYPHSAGKESLKDLYAGSLDIAHVADIPVVYALSGSQKYPKAGEMPINIFASMIHTNNSQKIIARTDHGIRQPKDLINKKIGVYDGTTSEFFLDVFLLQHGIADSLVTKIDIDITEHFEALKSGRVHAVANWEPYGSKILAEMPQNTISLSTKLDHSTVWLAVAAKSFINKNPDTIEAYLKALEQAQQYIQNHPKEVQKLVARNTDTSAEILSKLWDDISYEMALSERMLVLLEDERRWLSSKDYMNMDTTKSSIQQSIYFKAMENVYPQGITIIR